MPTSRIRKVQTQREFDSCVDDFVTPGYRIKEHGETTTMLKKNTWGSAGGHILWALMTVWWTYGVGNLIYALYAYYASDEVLIRREEVPPGPDLRSVPESQV